MTAPEPIPTREQVNMTSAPMRFNRILAKYGEVNFEDPLYYEGNLDLALLHSFGSAGLSTRNCEPFERLERELYEGQGHNLTPMMLIMPSGFDELTHDAGFASARFVSFIAALNADKPVFVSRVSPQAETKEPASADKQPPTSARSRTIALQARAAQLDTHMLVDGGRYYKGSDPTFFSYLFGSPDTTGPHGLETVLEIPLYVSDDGSDSGGAKPPRSGVLYHNWDVGNMTYLTNPFVLPLIRVGWHKLTQLMLEAYEPRRRPELGDEQKAYELAINTYAMLRDIGFSIEEMNRESPSLVRHVERMHTVKHLISVVERAGQN